MMTVTIISSPKCNLHNMGDEHPEQPARLHQINDQLIASGLEYVVHFANSAKIELATIKLAHDSEFVDKVISSAPQKEGECVFIDEDTVLMSKSLDAVLHSAGAVKDAVDLIQAGNTQSAFCSVRPPGHHAGYANSSGFCIFNNVAIGAKYALDVIGLQRVAIVDFDVHHGDGTQDIVAADDRIMFCSSFQHPFYPFSGHEPTREGILNVPIPAGTSGGEYRQLVAHWFAALDKFKPDLIFISAGFDAHAEDEMAYLRLVENDYVWLTEQIKAIADKHCEGHIISVLEGGYALSALARSVVAHLKTLAR
jgi:acetoin utilization deacetylase AcuC-like enzyme